MSLVNIRELGPYKIDRPFGLNNFSGVACHFNSLLQSLFSCPAFTHGMIQNRPYFESKNNSLSLCIISMLEFLIDKNVQIDVYLAKSPELSKYILMSLMKRLEENNKADEINLLFGRSQECAHEGLTLLLQMIDCDLINKLFELRWEKTYQCNACGYELKNTDAQFYHSVGHDRVADKKSFIINLRLRHEIIGDYNCENCKTKSTCKMVSKLTEMNKIIIVMFEKFTRKSYYYFPSTFMIKSACGFSLDINAVAQIEHYGSMSGGHYVSIASRNDKFYRFDDSNVSPAELGATDNTFLVFYHISY